jgi:hypothetical protein
VGTIRSIGSGRFVAAAKEKMKKSGNQKQLT